MIFASAGYTVSLYDIEPKQVSMVSRQGHSQDPTTAIRERSLFTPGGEQRIFLIFLRNFFRHPFFEHRKILCPLPVLAKKKCNFWQKKNVTFDIGFKTTPYTSLGFLQGNTPYKDFMLFCIKFDTIYLTRFLKTPLKMNVFTSLCLVHYAYYWAIPW